MLHGKTVEYKGAQPVGAGIAGFFKTVMSRRVMLPAGGSTFPREITKAPRKWAERILQNLVYWNDAPRGGHFAAWEQPQIFVEEVRKCFALMR